MLLFSLNPAPSRPFHTTTAIRPDPFPWSTSTPSCLPYWTIYISTLPVHIPTIHPTQCPPLPISGKQDKNAATPPAATPQPDLATALAETYSSIGISSLYSEICNIPTLNHESHESKDNMSRDIKSRLAHNIAYTPEYNHIPKNPHKKNPPHAPVCQNNTNDPRNYFHTLYYRAGCTALLSYIPPPTHLYHHTSLAMNGLKTYP